MSKKEQPKQQPSPEQTMPLFEFLCFSNPKIVELCNRMLNFKKEYIQSQINKEHNIDNQINILDSELSKIGNVVKNATCTQLFRLYNFPLSDFFNDKIPNEISLEIDSKLSVIKDVVLAKKIGYDMGDDNTMAYFEKISNKNITTSDTLEYYKRVFHSLSEDDSERPALKEMMNLFAAEKANDIEKINGIIIRLHYDKILYDYLYEKWKSLKTEYQQEKTIKSLNTNSLKKPATKDIPNDKIICNTDIKNIVKLFSNLRKLSVGERNVLEASDGVIAGFIIRSFVDDVNYEPYDISVICGYLGKDVQSSDEQLQWNGDVIGLTNIWIKLRSEPDQNTPYIKKPANSKIIKCIQNNFIKKDGKRMKPNTLKRNLEHTIPVENKDKNKFNIKELMEL